MYRVAIIDDEPHILSGIHRSICWEEYGFHIAMKSFEPFEALEQTLEQRPELVLVDIKMPGLSGIDFIKRCRSAGLESFFIVISAYDDFAYAKSAISLGVSEYLLKPIERSELVFAVEAIRDKLTQKAQAKPADPAAEELRAFERLLHYVDQNYCEDVTLKELSDKFFFTNTYICNLFKKQLGTTFTHYINDLRLRRSYQLLSETDRSISKVAMDCGFTNCSYFAKLFREKYGVVPNQLRSRESKR